MNLQEAVDILKSRKHRGEDDWTIATQTVTGPEPVRVASKATAENFTAFETIAIAEKYLKGDTPDNIRDRIAREIGE